MCQTCQGTMILKHIFINCLKALHVGTSIHAHTYANSQSILKKGIHNDSLKNGPLKRFMRYMHLKV
jgi:hypothetical protein